MKKLLLIIGLLTALILFASGGTSLKQANIDSHDLASLQDGARTYMNYCAACHSLKYMRFNRLGADLQLTDEEIQANLMFRDEKITDFIRNSMPAVDSVNWFGKQPPDLSLVGRSRGADWLYSYLLSFYEDETKAVGTNNTVFKDVGMPHVLAELQGTQIFNKDGHLELIEGSGTLTAGEYDTLVTNLVNFLVYVSEPIKNYRSSLGWKVLAFLLLLFILSLLLKKEYWRDIH